MKKIQVDDFSKFNFLSGIEVSPNGDYLGFISHKAKMDDNKYLSNIMVYDKLNKEILEMTSNDSESNFKWYDNNSLVFTSLRDPKDKEKKDEGNEITVLYKLSLKGGEAKKFLTINKNIISYEFLQDNTIIASVSFDQNQKDLLDLSESEIKDELKKRKEEKDYEVLEEIPYWSNGGGFTSKERSRLALFNEDGSFDRYLQDKNTSAFGLDLNNDKSKVVFMGSTNKGKESLYNDIYLFSIKDKSVQKLDLPEISYSSVYFLNDETIILTGSDMKKLGINENNKFYIFNLNTKEFKCITEDLDLSTGNSVGSDSRYGSSKSRKVINEKLYFVSTEGINSYLNRIDINGQIEKIITEEGSIDGVSIYKDDIYYIGMKRNSLQELFTLKDNESHQLTTYNDWVKKERYISAPVHLSLKIENNMTIDGFILKPINYDSTKTYPAVVEIHGGPKTVYGTVFYHELQLLASEGYFVIYSNPRGSDGKGNEFSDIRGKYGDIDYEDLMGFTDLALTEYPNIDKDNLFVTGGSYGGFMTNWIIGHTNRFKAAASQRSISNWISMFNTTDIGYYFADDQTGATPWSNMDQMWDQSPLKYADKVKTPTLFIHSEQDYRCWLTEGLQMFTALKYHNVDSRLCLFKEENHELSRSGNPKHRLRRLNEILNWFDKYKNL